LHPDLIDMAEEFRREKGGKRGPKRGKFGGNHSSYGDRGFGGGMKP
jgi:hypothetical protein